MAFCCEVHYCITTLHHVGYRRVTNVHANKLQSRIIGDSSQVAEVSCVGQLVHNHNVVAGVLFEHVKHEIRPDETGAAGDEYLHGLSFN